MDKKLEKLQEIIGYQFQRPGLLAHALTHSSYANERHWDKTRCNERLEFLGDAVLELVSSNFLYHQFPDMPEGEMTKLRASLVCEPTLAYCAEEIPLGDYLYLGKGEDMCGGREKPSILSDAFEALIGAIYLDGGIENAKRFIREHIISDIDELVLLKDGKTALQQLVQQDENNSLRYETEDFGGPQHNKVFKSKVYVNDKLVAEGKGHSKKNAEQQAALNALKKLKAEN